MRRGALPCPTRHRLAERFAGLPELVRLKSLIQDCACRLWPGCLGYHPWESAKLVQRGREFLAIGLAVA